MAMRAGGPQRYSDMEDESEVDEMGQILQNGKTYQQARADFQFVQKFLDS